MSPKTGDDFDFNVKEDATVDIDAGFDVFLSGGSGG
jgi:hypothetical protein